MEPNKYDLIIIGAGPIGLNCAVRAKEAGLKYLVLEKGVLVNSLYRFPTNMTFFSTSELLEIGGVPFISHGIKPTRRESLEYFRRVWQSWDLKVNFYEEVMGMRTTADGYYEIVSAKGLYYTHSVIVATGFYDTAKLINVPGEDLPKVKHFYDEPHLYIGQKLLIIGAANSACDVAIETYNKGAEVTMVIRQDNISPRVKYWIRPNIENRIKEGSIKVYFNSTVAEIRPKEVLLNTPKGQVLLPNDWILAMTGYEPNFEFMEKIGIELTPDEQRKPLHHPETLETTLPNVYIAGVIVSGKNTSKLFIENTRIHADMIIRQIKKKVLVS